MRPQFIFFFLLAATVVWIAEVQLTDTHPTKGTTLTRESPVSPVTLTLKPEGRKVARRLQKKFRRYQQDIYTQWLEGYSSDQIQSFEINRNGLEGKSTFYENEVVFSVFWLPTEGAENTSLVHFARVIPETQDRVKNLGFVVFDFRNQVYRYFSGAGSLSGDLLIILEGNQDTKTLRLPIERIARNDSWLTFSEPAGGIKSIDYALE